MSEEQVEQVGTALVVSWSGKVHAARRGVEATASGEMQAACSRAIYGIPMGAPPAPRYASRQQELMWQKRADNGRFDTKDVCLNCAGAVKKADAL